MIIRDVLIDGSVYGAHEVVSIKHVAGRRTSITVRSSKSNPRYGPSAYVERTHDVDLDDTLTFSGAEELVSAMDAYSEHVDPETALLTELAPTLTDEQAVTVLSVYPEWSADGSYSADDRVRYSDGFYRCLQAHDAQESWNPAASASLWSAIIDATVLPIGEYPLWQQPSSTNPYMEGDKVTFNGSVWTSVIDNNVWAPGVFGWEMDAQAMQLADLVEPWAQPDSTNPYPAGALVSHNGGIWSSDVDGNVWEPGVYGWTWVSDMEMQEPVVVPDEPTEPEPEPEPSEPEVPEWTQPDSTSPYMAGDKVVHNGGVWESLVDNNVWEPGTVGTEALWQEVA
jgi:hypothetical protein